MHSVLSLIKSPTEDLPSGGRQPCINRAHVYVSFHFSGSARILTGSPARVKAPPPASNEQDHEVKSCSVCAEGENKKGSSVVFI